jgi:phage shock protein E
MKILLSSLLVITVLNLQAVESNPNVDFQGFMNDAQLAQKDHASHRVSEQQFITMQAEPNTIVLDARSADKYLMRHVVGAVSLPFTDFTQESLAKVLPNKKTRILIYCNNNFSGDETAFAGKGGRAALNISTLVALRSYGYTNVFELGEYLDVNTTKLPFAGSSLPIKK